MSLRYLAAAAAFGLVAIATAGDKKKLDYAPETGPKPRQLPGAGELSLPDPGYLRQPPQCFPAEQQFPLVRELNCQQQAACPTTPIERQTIKSYSVGDLVIQPPPAGRPATTRPETHHAELIKKLTAAVEPKSWAWAGGSGTVEYFPLGMALVVNAAPTVHSAIEKYLDDQRQIQDTQFEVKVIVATVTDAVLEKLGLARDFGPTGKAGEVRARTKFLSADDVRGLDLQTTDCLELTAPTLVVLNGQEGCASNGQVEHFLTGVDVRAVEGQLVFTPKNEPHQLGVEARVRPCLSADRRFVKLSVAAQARDVTRRPVGQLPISTKIKPVFENGAQGAEVPFTQFLQDPRIVTRLVDETVTMPDGGTVVFYGGPATVEETVREKPGAFADVPFLQELMARDKKVSATNHLLVFATPRVVKGGGCDECVQFAGGTGKLASLMTEYHRACRSAQTDEARRLAMECLVIDPTCFGKK